MDMKKKTDITDFNLIAGQVSTPIDPDRVIRGHLVDLTNTLQFNKSTGDVVYTDKLGNAHQGHLSPRGNSYLLLSFLSDNPRKVFTADEIEKVLNKQRRDAFSTPDRRVRDTIQTIRKELKIVNDKVNDFFLVDKGFGLTCKVEISS